MTSFVVGIMVAMCSGTQYAFGVYVARLKDELQLSQQQAQTLGIMLNTGAYLGHPFTGTMRIRLRPARHLSVCTVCRCVL